MSATITVGQKNTLHQCEKCRSVTVYPFCLHGHGSARPLSDAETERYIAAGPNAI